jgi:hypothetical protein
MVYHKNYPFDAITHEREAEKDREKLVKLARSEEHLKSFGKDWFEVDKHPFKIEQAQQVHIEDPKEDLFIPEDETKGFTVKRRKRS